MKYKYIIFFFVILLVIQIQNIFAKSPKPASISITVPTLSNLCVGSSAYTSLNDIVITENLDDDIAAQNHILFLKMPTGFELQTNTGTIIAQNGRNITAEFMFVSSNGVFITFNATGIDKSDVLTISGLKVRATSVLTNANMIIETGSTNAIVGVTLGTSIVATFSSVALPSSPVITAGNSQSFCVGTNTSSTNIAATGTGIIWYSDVNLTTQVTTGSNPTLADLLVSTTSAGTFVRYAVSDNGTCKSTASVLTISITALPTLLVANNGTSVCAGQTITFTGSGTSIQYYFEIVQGVTSIAIQNYSAINTYTTSNALPTGSYLMRVFGRDVNNCISLLNSTNFTINTIPSVPTITLGNSQSFCVGMDVLTTNIAATGSGTIRWYSDINLTTQVTTGLNPSLGDLSVSTTSVGTFARYVVNDNGTCKSLPITLVINITAIPTMAVISSATSICRGKTITFTATGTSNYRFELLQGVTSLDIQGYGLPNTYTTSNSLPAGNYTLRAWGRDVSNCISTLSTTNFTIHPLPSIPVITAGNSQQFCEGTPISTIINTTGTGTRRWFSDINLTSAVSSLPNPTLNNLGITSTNFPNVYTYYVVNDDGTCFSNVVTVTITIQQSPIVSLISSDVSNIICEGKTITFTATGNSTQYSFDLRLSGVSQLGFPTAFSPTSTYTTSIGLLSNNNYSIVVTGRLPNGCTTVSNTINFQVKPTPTVNFVWPSGTTTYSSTDNIPINLAGAGSPIGGVFSGNGVSGNTFTPSLAGVGTQIITYTYTDANNCQGIANVTISVTTGGFIIPISFCEGDSPTSPLVNASCTTGSVSSKPGSPPAAILNDFRFDPSAITIPTGQNFFKWEGSIYFNPDTGPMFPCPSYGFYIFTYVFRKPNPTISGNFAVCENAIGKIYSVSNLAGNTYAWNVTGGTITSGQGTNSITVDWGSAGSGNIQLVQTANYTSPLIYSCAKTLNQSVLIFGPPNPTILSAPGEVCQNTQSTYSVTSSPGSTYLWSVTGGIIVGSNTGNSVVVNWGNTGLGNVSITQNTNSCLGTNTKNITIRSTPVPDITGLTSVCQGRQNTIYSVSNAALLPGSSSNNFQWVVTGGGGTIVGSSTGSSISVDWGYTAGWWTTATGTVQVTQQAVYSGSFILSCTGTKSIDVTINPSPRTGITAGSSNCEGEASWFSSIYGAGQTYNWTVENGTINSPPGSSGISVTWTTAGSGKVTLIKTDANGCSGGSVNSFTIKAKPNPVINSITLPVLCANTTGVMYDTSNNPGSTYLWTISGGTIVSGANNSAVVVNWGGVNSSASISVKEINSLNCERTFTRNITLVPPPNPIITIVSGVSSVCAGSAGNVYSSSGNGIFDWSVSNGTITSGQSTNQITVTWGGVGSGSISVTNTNLSGCVATKSQDITIQSVPGSIIGTNQVCAGKTGENYSALIPGGTYFWTVTGGSINGGNTNSSIVVDWGTGSIGSVQLIQTNPVTNCSSTSNIPVTINPLPNPIIIGSSNVCTLSIQSYSVANSAGQIFTWAVSGGVINSGQSTNTIQVTWGTPGGGTVSLTQTNTLFTPNCTKNVNATISILPLPNPIISGSSSVCQSASTIQYSVPPVPNNNYEWSVTGGSITIGQGSDKIWVNWGATGLGAISLTQTDVSGCVRTATQSININPLPNPNITQDISSSLCENTTGNRFYVTSNSGRNYNWTIVGGTITSGQGSNLVTVSWGAATSTASISVTETISATNCSNSTSNNLVIIPKPTPSIVVSNNFVCANQINAVYSTASVVGSNYVWNIIGGTITSGQGEHEVKVSWGIANPSASISVTQTAANFCTQIASKSIIVNPLPVPNISGDVAVCESSTNNIYSTNFTTGNSYFWLVVGGTITAGQNTNQITVTWGSAGIGSVSVDEKIILTNCIVTTTQNITINTLPTPNITNNNITNNVAICETSIGNIYEVINSVSNTYLWDVTGGVITNGQNINKITVTWGSAGTGIVKVTETITATGCSQISTQNIIINPLPTPNIQPISGLFSVCAGSVQNYKIVNNLTNQNYNWVVTGGSITSGQGTKEISVTWGTNPIGEVEITQTNNITNCSKLDSKNILINPLPTPNIIGNTTVCAFESGGAFGNIFTYTTSSVSGHLYNWTIGSNGTIITGQGSNSITVKWANQSAAYVNTLRVTQTSNSIPACVVSHEINVNVKPVPVLDVNVEYLCFGDITKFTPSVIDTTWTRNWSIISDGFVSAASIPTFVFANTGIKTLTLTVTNADNCQYIITKTFVISPVPSPNYTFTGTCLGNITSFKDTSNVATANGNSIVTRIWDFGDGSPLLSGNFTNPTHNYTTAGTYTTSLTTITNNNCSKTLSKIINIFPSFSPSDVAPYSESFDAGSRGWIAGSYDNTLSTWNLGNSSPTRTINNGNTGDFWSTGLGANYTNSQRSYVESPCFNLSGLTRPMLSIKKWSDAEEGLDGTVILYTTNQGLSWKVLGDVGQGSSWYNQTNVLSSPGPDDETINPRRLGWTGRDGNWINARFALDVVKAEAGGGSVRFRVAFSSNADNLPGTWDGFAFDDFRILNRDGKVLLEHFTNMVSTTENDVVDNFPPESVKIQYHTNLGNDNNKLYQENKPDGGARALFYGISQVERGAMNGKPNVQEPFSVWGNNQYLQNSLNSPKFDVKITFPPITPTNGILNINVAVKANLAQNTPVLVHIVLVEKQVTSAQLGMTGTTIYKNIVRKMLPSAGGTFVSSAWNPNDLRNFSQNIPIYAVAQENEAKFYDWNNLSVVAFVQDYTTQEVYQSDQASPTTLPTLISAVETDAKNQCWIYPNPTSDEVFIGFKEEVTRSCVWEIYTMQGVKVSQGNINENEKGIRIDVTKYPKGMYIVKIIEPTSKLVWQSKLQIR